NHLRLDHNPTMGSVMEFLKAARLDADAKGEPKGDKGGDDKGKNLKGKGPRHFRQRHRHANALTLNLDLIGPWTAGDDHALAGPARHILVATLGVPILKDGRPLPLEKEKEGEEKEREEGNEDDGRGVGPIDTGDGDRQLVLEDPESREESEEGELSPEEYAALYERQEAKWREIAKDLQEPVQVHEVLFAEPLRSKRSEEVLRGIQRIYSKITVMNLSVRRFHVAPVVYAGVRDPIKFVGDVDGEDCHSLCLPPILYHRRQNLRLAARKLKRKEAGEQVEILPAKAIFQRKGQQGIVLGVMDGVLQAGFAAPGEYWEITGALYGLQTSPADWAIYRDETLPTLEVWCDNQTTHLQRSKYDQNLWLLYCPKTSKLIAALTIYVDDLLLSGTPEASRAVWEAIKAKWKISEPEYADQGVVTFCGFEIRQQPDGIHVGQAKYVQSLLDKYSKVLGTASCPYARESEVIDAKPQESIDKLRRAQAVAGELLWLATRTRPDLAFGVSRIGQLITRDVDQALRQGHGTADQLPIARDFNLIEVFAAELQSSLDGMTLAEGIYGLLEELAEAPQQAFLYNDNVGACTVMTIHAWGSVHKGVDFIIYFYIDLIVFIRSTCGAKGCYEPKWPITFLHCAMEDVSTRRRLGNSSSNPPEAASSPSAEDQSKSRPRAQDDTAEKTTTPDQRGVARGSAERGSGKGQGETAAIADEGASTAAGATVNPFWSERAKREAQLVAARPDFLGGEVRGLNTLLVRQLALDHPLRCRPQWVNKKLRELVSLLESLGCDLRSVRF
ncbi:TY5A, partial [Symbiodinium necroappetens]